MASFTDDDIEQRQRLLDEWVQTRRQIAVLEARAANLLNDRLAVLDADVQEFPFHRDAIHRSMIAEYSAAGHISKGSVEYAFSATRELHSWLPAARAAFEAGDITAAHVREIACAGGVVREAVTEGRVDAETLTLFDTAATVAATGDTPARTRVLVRQIAAALAGETLVDRHTRAKKERAVTVRPAGDGLALLMVVLPEYLATAILDRLTTLAHEIISARDDQEPALDPDLLDDGPEPIYETDLDPSADFDPSAALVTGAIFGDTDTFTTDPHPGLTVSDLVDPLTDPTHSLDIEHYPGDGRGIDEIRADLLTDLLLASDPTAAHGTGLDNITARIQVTVAATTIADVDDRPAELDGHGPLHPDAARALAGRTTMWSRLFIDPTGMITETDSYVPTASMRRHLRARDQHCRFPGCRMPVDRCQSDHNHDHAKGGSTSLGNLSYFCAGHHILKHPDVDERHRWDARLHPDGSIRWTSPLGNTYIDPALRRVMFV
ncbi:HNH endonuclease signature motif containing protein [Microbacterium aurantiacum]|uniref:HNH endonuclease signature motif containing protein n=1 Tax=Microbacterium aurantiacum TaxID=162393 RepID=UPI000C80D4D6|nr:HNH endonuclease signature motif containing protein [Microbacterium aurantiacum]